MRTKCGDGPAIAVAVTALFAGVCLVALVGFGLWAHFDERFGLAVLAFGVCEIPFGIAFLYAMWDDRQKAWRERQKNE